MLVVKDSSANKCGVVCSSYEILAAHLLSRSAFEAQKAVIVAEVLDRLSALARLEADQLIRDGVEVLHTIGGDDTNTAAADLAAAAEVVAAVTEEAEFAVEGEL